jgi:hypothetical protein
VRAGAVARASPGQRPWAEDVGRPAEVTVSGPPLASDSEFLVAPETLEAESFHSSFSPDIGCLHLCCINCGLLAVCTRAKYELSVYC